MALWLSCMWRNDRPFSLYLTKLYVTQSFAIWRHQSHATKSAKTFPTVLPGVQRPRTLAEQAIRVGYPLLNQCKNCWKTTDNTSGNIAEQAIRVGYPVVNQCKSCWNTPYSIILLEILLCAIYKKFVWYNFSEGALKGKKEEKTDLTLIPTVLPAF